MDTLLGPIVEIVKLLWNPIGKCLKYHRGLHENMTSLERELDNLNGLLQDINQRLNTELRPGKQTSNEVQNWLRNVERITGETHAIQQKFAKVKYLLRSRLGKLTEVKIGEVKKCHEKGKLFNTLTIDVPLSGLSLSVSTITGTSSTQRSLNMVWEYLIDHEEVRKIGIYGMGGVGKTTIIKHINNRLLKKENDKFDNVIWVTVSKELDIIKLQNDIARALNRDISKEEDETRRAAMVSEMLGLKERHVLILDDMWKGFSLEDVGIPEPTKINGCKLILTTRSLDVCRYMGCKDFKVEVLPEEEARNLFLDKVGRDVLHVPSLEPLVEQVLKECAGLPLAIVTIASSMRNVTAIHQWENALNELRERVKSVQGMENVVFERLKFSYSRLQGLEVQSCFLYCALYPEDREIYKEELVRYWIYEGLVDEMSSRKVQIDRGRTIVDMLVNYCLLESSKDRRVKMHDLIRDMALKITRESPRFMVKAGIQLRECPNDEEWTDDLERVSLMCNQISEIPSGTSPRCPRLSTLLLNDNFSLKSVPHSFFVYMHLLRVLDLSETSIEILPDSVSDLENLTALVLICCYYLVHVPSLGKLRKLHVLDLTHCSSIKQVPQCMNRLVNLKCLYMGGTFRLEMFPTEILPSLLHLQYLKLDSLAENVTVRWQELGGLTKLEGFQGRMSVYDYNRYVASQHYQGLTSYRIIVGKGRYDPFCIFRFGDFPFLIGGKKVTLKKCDLNISGEGSKVQIMFPHDIQALVISECDINMSSCLCDAPLFLNNAAKELKECTVVDCNGVECIWSSSTSSTSAPVTKEIQEFRRSTLQSLDRLYLVRLSNFKAFFVWGGVAPPTTPLSNLKDVTIISCPKLKTLFTPQVLQHLQNLQVIDVRDCQQMEEIIVVNDEERTDARNNHDTDIAMPKLTLLYLHKLPELKSFCSRIMICDSIEQIGVFGCPKLKRLPLSLPMLNGQPSHPFALKEICVLKDEWWESLGWDHPDSKNVLQPFVKHWNNYHDFYSTTF